MIQPAGRAGRACGQCGKLNWRTSIIDLMSDSVSMNIWLHKEVLKRVAANGGNVPANLLDWLEAIARVTLHASPRSPP